ncbi:DMT family transporter [Rhizosaccharibacter radicis]|uniref:Multidrug efflux SMR transporter n=1 Tax=Rhizosaccharibacter radicis TaxID=2782605 RepID=A0ABT1W2K7_9PROT|nr:multidrug efflux SMR transporter [Acetobacteraceae bacterium KSS12]
MAYLHLAIAILCEVLATSCLKLSDGFSRLVPTAISLAGYGICFFFLSLCLRTMPTGVAYAIWSGLGIVLIAGIAWVFQGQRLDMPAMAGMALIIAGVAVMNLFSRTGAH